MTPKNKSKQLIDKFTKVKGFDYDCEYIHKTMAEECALIAIDEILQIQSITMYPVIEDNMIYGHKDYWNKVKQETNSLQ